MKHDLKSLIGAQQGNLDSLRGLSEKLFALLAGGEPDERLEMVLDERTALFGKITGTDAKLRDAIAAHPEAEHAALEKLQSSVQAVVELDARCSALLQDEKSKVAEKMRSVNRGGTLLKNYGRPEDGGSRFISIKK